MAEAFARTAAELLVAGFDVLPETYALTTFSWAAKQHNALGALVIASHNPGSYLGLKVKGLWWIGSPEITQQIEALLAAVAEPSVAKPGSLKTFNPWRYCEALWAKVDMTQIRAIAQEKLTVFADVMHGAAAGGLATLLGVPVQEINDRDPCLVAVRRNRYLTFLSIPADWTHRRTDRAGLAVGLVFDGDSDRLPRWMGRATFLALKY